MEKRDKLIAGLDCAVYCLTCCYMLVITWSHYHLQGVIVAAAVFGVIRCCIRRPRLRLSGKHVYFVGAFYAFTLLSVFLNEVNSDTLKNLDVFRAHYINTLPAALVVIFFVREKEKARGLFPWLALSLFFNNIAAIYQHFQGIERVYGLTDRYMDFAGVLIITVPLCLHMLLNGTGGRLSRAVWWCALLSSLPAVFFSGTRIVWIVLTLVGIYSLFFLVRDKKKLVCACVGAALLAAAAFACFPAEKARLFTIGNMEFQSNKERTLMWQSAAHMFLEHPLVGVGLGNYTQQYREKYILPEAKERMQYHAHNIYLQYLAETGIFAFLAYMTMIGYFIKESFGRWRQYGDVHAFWFLCVTLAVSLHGLTDANMLFKVEFKLYALLLGCYLLLSGHISCIDGGEELRGGEGNP